VNRGTGITVRRAGFALGLLGVWTVALGLYEANADFAVFAWSLAGLVLLFSLLEMRQGGGDSPTEFSFFGTAGPLLWVVGVWIIFRSFVSVAPQLILLPVGLIGWLVISFPLQALLVPFVAVLGMEVGLWAFDFQELAGLAGNLLAYGAAGLGISAFMSSKAYRQRMRKALIRAKRDTASRQYARDLGLFDELPDILNVLPDYDLIEDPEAGSQPAVETITAAFDLQLELIRQTLALSTVALLWPDPEGQEYRLRSIATTRKDIAPGPFRIGAGITGALMGAEELVSLAPATPSLGVPYYLKQLEVGGVLAVRLPDDAEEWLGFDDKKIAPVLCGDRPGQEPWTEQEKTIMTLCGRKLALDVNMGRQFQAMARERSAIQRVCLAMRELNGALALEQVLAATIKAVRTLVGADFISISLVQGNSHCVALAEGEGSELLMGREFSREEGLVGQVLKINRPLPAKAQCHGPTQVFGHDHLLTGYHSLLVLPLQKEKGEATGALTVAVKKADVFTKPRQEILELIAAQVAVKVDLGQAHEEINRLATIDGLTGLINHRTFQHGFDVMLVREERRAGALSLLLCDIDHFKKINDSYGHPFGDKVLKEVAGILRRAARSVDLAGRYGGEEFVLVLEGSGEQGGHQMAERIRQEIEKMVLPHESGPVRITLSLGLAVYPDHGTDKERLIRRADKALYRAKKEGRNRVVVWQEE
jgi:diguanylate cyclase (GGDEF)-like protein